MKIEKALEITEGAFAALHRLRADIYHAALLDIEPIAVRPLGSSKVPQIQVGSLEDFKKLAHRNVEHHRSESAGYGYIHITAECAYGSELTICDNEKNVTEEMWLEIEEMESWSVEGEDA